MVFALPAVLGLVTLLSVAIGASSTTLPPPTCTARRNTTFEVPLPCPTDRVCLDGDVKLAGLHTPPGLMVHKVSWLPNSSVSFPINTSLSFGNATGPCPDDSLCAIYDPCQSELNGSVCQSRGHEQRCVHVHPTPEPEADPGHGNDDLAATVGGATAALPFVLFLGYCFCYYRKRTRTQVLEPLTTPNQAEGRNIDSALHAEELAALLGGLHVLPLYNCDRLATAAGMGGAFQVERTSSTSPGVSLAAILYRAGLLTPPNMPTFLKWLKAAGISSDTAPVVVAARALQALAPPSPLETTESGC